MIIIDIDMPKSCSECPFTAESDGAGRYGVICNADLEPPNKYARDKDCPLINRKPIPDTRRNGIISDSEWKCSGNVKEF